MIYRLNGNTCVWCKTISFVHLIKMSLCTREHTSIDRDNRLLYARAGVRTPDTPLIHLKR